MKLSHDYQSIQEQLEEIKHDINRIKYEAIAQEEKTQQTLVQILSKISIKQKTLEQQLNELQYSKDENWDELVHVYENVQHDKQEALARVRLH